MKHTPEALAKMSAASTGRIKSAVTREKIGNAHRGKKNLQKQSRNIDKQLLELKQVMKQGQSNQQQEKEQNGVMNHEQNYQLLKKG